MICKVYAHEGDTLSIINSYLEIKDFFKDRGEYYNTFIKYYSLAKYFYYDIEYTDQESISLDKLIGEWVKVNNRKDGAIRINNSKKIEFLANGFFKSDDKFFFYDIVGDNVLLSFQNNPDKVVSRIHVKYSQKWQTLILNFNNSPESENQFFRKTSELDLLD